MQKTALPILGSLFAVSVTAEQCVSIGLPENDTRLQAWYHWVNDAITKEGLTADIQAMREFGISTAHFFWVRQGVNPTFAATMDSCSPEWEELVKHGFAEAAKNGVKVSFHNSPGWTGSGGPWITPELAAKEVTSSETDFDADGSSPLNGKLEMPRTTGEYYREIGAFAFRLPEDPRPKDAEKLKCIEIELSGAIPRWSVPVEYERAFRPRTCSFRVDCDGHLYAEAHINASVDGKEWKTVGYWRNPFNGWHMSGKPPCVARLDWLDFDAKYFRVDFHRTASDDYWGAKLMPKKITVSNLEFSSLDRITRLCEKMTMSNSVFYEADNDDTAHSLPQQEIIDVSDRVNEGVLDWTPPSAGRWRVLRIGYTLTGKKNLPAMPSATGYDCEKLSGRGFRAHWDHFVTKVLSLAKEAKAEVVSVVFDSWDCESQNWIAEMPAEFLRRRGYPINRCLPVLAGYAVDSPADSARFLNDFSRTVSDLYCENYFDLFSQLCHEAGVKSVVEPYDGPFDQFRAARNVDIPTGEFWLDSNRDLPIRVKFVASVRNVNGRPTMGAESFTSGKNDGRWQITPRQMKERGDMAFACGVNRIVYHSYVHQPEMKGPGMSLGIHGTQLNRHTTWWKEGADVSRYFERAQKVLSEGREVSQLLVLAGDGSPNRCCPLPPAIRNLEREGYTYDLCSVVDLARVEFRDGEFVFPSGARYSLLVNVVENALRASTLSRLADLAQASGGRVYSCPVTDNPSLDTTMEEWRAARDRAFTVIRPLPDSAALMASGVEPSFRCDVEVRHIRRETADGRIILFIANCSGQATNATVSAAAPDGYGAELYDAVHDVTTGIAAERTDDGRLAFNVPLPSAGGIFVILRKNAASPVAAAETRMIRDLSTDWVFSSERTEAEEWPKLISWSNHSDAEIKYLSGRGVYEKKVNLNASEIAAGLSLDIGEVHDVAVVYVNGRRVATLWSPPYRCKLDGFVHEGENLFRVEVINTWPNRLIGDARARAGDKSIRDSGSHAMFDGWSAGEQLLPAGLLGPACLFTEGSK